MSFARSMIPLTMFLALSRLNLFVYGVSQSENDTIPSSSEEEDSYSNRRLGGGRHDNNDRRQRSLYNLGTTGIRSGTRTSSHSSHSNVDQQSSTVGTERNCEFLLIQTRWSNVITSTNMDERRDKDVGAIITSKIMVGYDLIPSFVTLGISNQISCLNFLALLRIQITMIIFYGTITGMWTTHTLEMTML